MKQAAIGGMLLFITIAFIGAVPRTMNYQGKLVDPSGVGITDTLPMVFRLYSSAEGGSPLWEMSLPAVAVTRGLFSVELSGFPDSVDFSEQYWLEVVVDGEAMSPREKLASAPYSLRAATAERAFNPVYSEANTTRRTGDFVLRAGRGATLTDDGGTINITIGSGTPPLLDVLAVSGDAAGRRISNLPDPVDDQDAATKHYVDNYVPTLDRVLAAGNNAGGYRITNLGEPTSESDAATKLYVDSHSGSGLVGSGSSNAVAVWTGSTSLGTGSITDNGSAVTISSPVTIAGNLSLSGNRITNVATPTASTDAATKAYVDAASGGGAMYWEINVTSATYNGNLGGYAGANAKCQAEFGSNSFMLNYSILANAYNGGIPLIINLSSAPPTYAWFGSARTGALQGTGNSSIYVEYFPVYPYYFWGNYTSTDGRYPPDCRGWTSSSSSDYGGVIEGSYGNRGYRACNNTYPIICATLRFISP